MPNPVEIIYPDIRDTEYVLQDDGSGPYIAAWTDPRAKPTQSELDAAVASYRLESAKFSKKADVDALYATTCVACTHLTYTWQADRYSSGAIVAKHYTLEGAPPATTTWVDAGNAIRTLDWADFVTLKDRIFSFHEAAFANKHTHRNAIDDLGNIENVNEYDITAGWPT